MLSCSGKRFAVTVVPNILEILSIASLVEVIVNYQLKAPQPPKGGVVIVNCQLCFELARLQSEAAQEL